MELGAEAEAPELEGRHGIRQDTRVRGRPIMEMPVEGRGGNRWAETK